MKFNQALKKARESAGLSQKQLADMLNVPASMISRYESTDTEPRIGFVLKAIEALGTTPNKFFDFEKNYQPIHFAQLLKEFRIANNFTAEKMSEKLNISLEDYEMFENKLKLPSLNTLNKIHLLVNGEQLNHFNSALIAPSIYNTIMQENLFIFPSDYFDIDEKTGKIIIYISSNQLTYTIGDEDIFIHLKSIVHNNVEKELSRFKNGMIKSEYFKQIFVNKETTFPYR